MKTQLLIMTIGTFSGLFCGYFFMNRKTWPPRVLKRVLLFSILAWVLWIFFLSVQKLANLQTQGIDFSLYDTTIWNTAHGNFFYTPLRNTSYLGTHFSPVLLLLVPAYLIHYTPYWLLLLQASALGFAGIPLYIFARRILKDDVPAFLLSMAWLFVPQIQWINLCEFHSACLQPILIFSLLASITGGKQTRIFLLSFLLLLIREDAGLLLAAISIYIIARYSQQRRLGILLMAAGILWFFAATKVWMPLLTGREIGHQYVYTWLYRWLGKDYMEIAVTVITSPLMIAKKLFEEGRIIVYIKTFVPFMFVFILGGWTLIPLLLVMAMNFLSIYPHQHLLMIHYPAVIFTLLFIASIEGIRVLSKKSGRIVNAVSFAVLAGFIISSFFWGILPLCREFPGHLLKVSPHARRGHKIFQLIPPNASVATQDSLMPHVGARKKVYLIDKLSKTGYPVLFFGGYKGYPHEGIIPEYILLDRYTLAYPIKNVDLVLLRLLHENRYELISHEDGIFLFKKGPKNEEFHQKAFEESFLRFESEKSHKHVGRDRTDEKAGNGAARTASGKERKPGYLSFGTFIDLPPGKYKAVFRLKGKGSAATIDVSADKGQTILSKKDITFEESENKYKNYTLEFTLTEKKLIEMRVFYHGFRGIWIDRIDIRSPELTLEKEYKRKINPLKTMNRKKTFINH